MEDLAHRAWDGRRADQLPRYRQLRTDRFLEVSAAIRPDKEAIRFEDRSLTYRELDAMTNRAANGLLALGARPGDVVGVMAGNELDVFAFLYGLARAGLAVLPMNPKYTREEIEYQVGEAGAKFVVAPGHLEMADVFAKGHERAPDVEVDENSFFQVRFTSGTTGKPKAIATTHRSIGYMHQMTARELDYSEHDVALLTAPVAHAAFHIAASTVVVGGTLVLERGFDPRSIWELCDRHQISHTFLAPTMIAMSMASPGSGQSVKGVFVSASAFPPALKARFKERFPDAGIYDCYGATEIGLATLLRPTDPPDKDASSGRAAFGYELRILDADGNQLPPGEIGDIYVRGPGMSFGYVGSVEMKPGQARDGFVTVGDMGSVDDDGYLYVADRRDDLIVSGGLNVYPAEVEDVILRHPDVQEVAVVGVPDDTWGSVVVAAVSGRASAEDLDAHCRAVLARFKIPRQYVFVDELPKNLSGKILRRVIREQVAQAPPSTAG